MSSAYTGSWQSLYSMEGPPGKESGLQRMERIFPRLPDDKRQFLQRYLIGVLRGGAVSDNGSASRLRNRDFTTGMVAVELAERFLDADGKIPEEFYRALDVLPPHDWRTQYVLGWTLTKDVPHRAKKARIKTIAAAPDAEQAFRAMRRGHGICVPYEGMEQDELKDAAARWRNSATYAETDNYRPEDFEIMNIPETTYANSGETIA